MIDCQMSGIVASMVNKQTDYLGEGNPNWRGDNAKYLARHVRVRTARGSASDYECECGKTAKEWAHLHDTNPFEPVNYKPLCVKCHRAYDAPSVLKGENHPRAKLSAEDIQQIREQYALGGKTQVTLAAEFGVLQGTIHKIVSRKIWKGE